MKDEDKTKEELLIELAEARTRIAEIDEGYRSFAQVGLALSVEKNINKLLEMIVDEARELSNSDAGTLYMLNEEDQSLRFEIMQNESMNTRMGGTSGVDITLPNVPLYLNGEPNHSNVCSHVALIGGTVNIPDVYEAEGFDFTGPREYDKETGYRSKSMLVVPLKNHENDIIGVLQMLNAQDPETGEVIAFSPDYVDLTASLASQAAVALTNTQLIQDLRNLFYAFIKSIATAIDEKSPYTGGHINRVVDLTMLIAEYINGIHEGPFGNVRFNEDELEELRLAAWMHDVGKIITPEYVVDKATKLETIFDLSRSIEIRFNYIAKSIENSYLKKKMELMADGKDHGAEIKRLDEDLAGELQALSEDLSFIKDCNNAGEFMSDEYIARIEAIAAKTFFLDGQEQPYLDEFEVRNLSIRKGTLTDDERKIIEHHATMTMKILEQLPFPKILVKVPEYAGGHHEKLDGSGYPQGLAGDQLPIQSRIMAIADIFEALTAKDRPYRQPMKLSQVFRIMGFMKQDKHIDPDIFDLFINSRLYLQYARNALDPEQIDMPESP